MSRVFTAAMVAVALVAAGCAAEEAAQVPAGEAKSNVERAVVASGDGDVAARAVNDLTLDLLRLNTGLEEGNVALSPWSIATALAMARVGARGETATEMDGVLHVGAPAAFDKAVNALDQALRGRNQSTPIGGGDPLVVEVSAANRLFAQRGLDLLPGFLDTLGASYGASVGEVDFKADPAAAGEAINSWVAAETRDRIRKLIGDGVLDELTRLVLVNAVFLRADWATPFDPKATADGPFHTPSGDVTSRSCTPAKPGDGRKATGGRPSRCRTSAGIWR